MSIFEKVNIPEKFELNLGATIVLSIAAIGCTAIGLKHGWPNGSKTKQG
jgi:hypothetical protein